MAENPFAKYAPDYTPAEGENPFAKWAKPANEPSVAADMAKSVGAGLAEGAAFVAGLPGLLRDGAEFAARHAPMLIGGKPLSREEAAARTAEAEGSSQERFGVTMPDAGQVLTSGKAKAAVEAVAGPLHEPETRPGRYAKTAGEFVIPGLIAPGTLMRKAISYGILPGLASEAAGEATEGTPAELWARAGAAISVGGGAALFNAPGNTGRTVARATEGVTAPQLDAAEALFQEALTARLPLTRAEALQHVTNGGTNLASLQRVTEGSGRMKGFFAERPAQVEAAARPVFDAVGPQSAQPSSIGPRVAEAAGQEVADVQRAINTATRPAYQAAEAQRVGPQVHVALLGDDLYARTLQEVRADPALNRAIAHLPDDSVGVIDMVQRRMRETAENARVPGQATTSNTRAASFEDARTPAIAAAETATGSRPATATAPAVQGSYEQARAAQQFLRERYLEPMMQGPIGKIADRPETKRAIDALFPTKPVPGVSGEVGDAVAALSRRSPRAARELVRAHLEGTFNEATQRLASGANQAGGAKFAAVIRGNPEQAASLEAGIRALPGGDVAWPGVDRFLTILEAQGQRQAPGSATSFNTAIMEELKNGTALGTAGKVALGGGVKLPTKVMEALDRWRMGQSLDELARLFTDPNAGPMFRRLAETPVGSRAAAALAARLTLLGATGHNASK